MVRALLILVLVAAQSIAAPAPAPARAVLESGQLTWAPPPLVNPEVRTLTAGRTSTNLDITKDYIIRLPTTVKLGATILIGGRNIVIIGGHIRLPTFIPGTTTSADARAIYIKDAVGTVHIEGVQIDTLNDDSWGDAVSIDAPLATVQIQNVRVVDLKGMSGDTGFHGDVIQPWGGVGRLRVDKLSASTRFQGMFLPRDEGDIGSITIKRANIIGLPLLPGAMGGYLLWVSPPGRNSTGIGPFYDFSDFYIQPRAGTTLGKTIWPDTGVTANPLVVDANGFATWPTMSNVVGGIQGGLPPGGDFVPSGAAGLGYVSPGYSLTTSATATASSVFQGNTAQFGPAKTIDGSVADDSRWLSGEGDATPTLTIDFGGTKSVGEVHVSSGFNYPQGDPLAVLVNFAIEARVGGVWQQLRLFTGNQAAKVVWTGLVQADRIRLVVTDPSRSNPDIARVYEVTAYSS
ncbi:MAG TPA: hypothetical protein VF062_04335 [Candidatus Limnocylindrales bacterium]